MSCLCEYFTPERAEAAGLPRDYFEGKVCMECARRPMVETPQPDARRGLCVEDGCLKKVRTADRCDRHFGELLKSSPSRKWMRDVSKGVSVGRSAADGRPVTWGATTPTP